MMRSGSGLAAKRIERVFELSADAQINRREVAKDSPALQNEQDSCQPIYQL
jgi:hypothetical protein